MLKRIKWIVKIETLDLSLFFYYTNIAYMKYLSKMITFQDLPNEVALSFLITGCSLRCKGCHSPDSWNWNIGTKLTKETLSELIKKNSGLITAVLFFWGEWEEDNLIELLKLSKDNWLKTCLYTGLKLKQISKSLLSELDFIKVEPYKKELGWLNSPNTNQQLFSLLNGEKNKDLTFYFQKDNEK